MISPKWRACSQAKHIFCSVSSLEKKFDKLEAQAQQLKVNQSETRAKVKEKVDGLNKLNKPVDKQVEANCKKTHKTRYKALKNKL